MDDKTDHRDTIPCRNNNNIKQFNSHENGTVDNPELSKFIPHVGQEQDLSISESKRRKDRIMNTLALYSGYLLFGLATSSFGPSLVDLKELLQTDTKSIALTFTLRAAGSIIGCVVVATLVIGRLNYNIVLLLYTVLIIATTAIVPWMPNVIAFMAVAVIHGLACASLHSTSQVYILLLWSDTKNCLSVMQGMQTLSSVGSTIGPFILKPFLSEGGRDYWNDTLSTNLSMANVSYSYADMSNTTIANSLDFGVNTRSDTRVQYGFLTIACISIVAPILCVVAFIHEGKPFCLRRVKVPKNKRGQHEHKSGVRIVFVLLVATLCGIYISCEWITGNFIATFVIEGLEWERWKGPMVTAAFRGSFGLCRFASIFIARHVSPKPIAAVVISLICASFLVLTFATNVHESVVWVCISVAGGAMGPLFGVCMLLANKVVKVDGLIAGFMTGINSVGVMVSFALVGYLFQEYGHMSMVYYLLVCSLVMLLMFVVILIVTAKLTRAKRRHPSVEMDVVSVDECAEV